MVESPRTRHEVARGSRVVSPGPGLCVAQPCSLAERSGSSGPRLSLPLRRISHTSSPSGVAHGTVVAQARCSGRRVSVYPGRLWDYRARLCSCGRWAHSAAVRHWLASPPAGASWLLCEWQVELEASGLSTIHGYSPWARAAGAVRPVHPSNNLRGAPQSPQGGTRAEVLAQASVLR